MKRRLTILAALLLIIGCAFIAWQLAGLPPIRFILRYGLTPSCEPTGQKKLIAGVEFIEIGPGIFRMGSTYKARPADWLGKICAPFGLPWGRQVKPSNEMPLRWIEFRRGFWIAKTEITNGQIARFNPDHRRFANMTGDDFPAAGVTSDHAMEYCAWLSKQGDVTVRLPSESEWECAARAGGRTEYCFGDDEAELPRYAWFRVNAGGHAHAVAKKRPNRWGLYDMHGNIHELCLDARHCVNDSLEDAPVDGSPWVDETVSWRISRGGSFLYPAQSLRSSRTLTTTRDSGGLDSGFRPAFSN